MEYHFSENRHPEQDSNVDLDFDNDALYEVINDSMKSNKTNVNIKNINPQQNPVKKTERMDNVTKSNADHSGIYTYIYFIIAVIILVIIWYFYGLAQDNKKKDIIDTYPDHRELTMMSPDMGMGIRYTLN